jgi:hypothetical protein
MRNTVSTASKHAILEFSDQWDLQQLHFLWRFLRATPSQAFGFQKRLVTLQWKKKKGKEDLQRSFYSLN